MASSARSRYALTMSEPTYEIVCRGKLVKDADPAQVRVKLMALFKSDAARIEALLASSKATLKRGLSREQAAHMQEALREAGLIVAMLSEGSPQIDTPVVPAFVRSSAPPVAARELQKLASASEMAQPLGDRESAAIVTEPTVEITIVENLSDAVMMPVGSILDAPIKRSAPEIPESNLTLADLGEVIAEFVKQPAPEIPDSNLTLGEPGEELDQAPHVEIIELPDMDMTLAEPGALVSEPASKIEPRYFDLSGMTLEPIEEPEPDAPSALQLALLQEKLES